MLEIGGPPIASATGATSLALILVIGFALQEELAPAAVPRRLVRTLTPACSANSPIRHVLVCSLIGSFSGYTAKRRT
jgi:hypothetical protein